MLPTTFNKAELYSACQEAVATLTPDELWFLYRQNPTGWTTLADLLKTVPKLEQTGVTLRLQLLAEEIPDYATSERIRLWKFTIIDPRRNSRWLDEILRRLNQTLAEDEMLSKFLVPTK